MKKTIVVLLTLLVAISGIGLPIWVAIEESERQAFKAESVHALGYARDVMMRADETGMQVRAGTARLTAEHADAPCAPAAIDVMRQIDLASSYIQAVGYVEGNRMLCSSIAGPSSELDLGPVDYVTAGGAQVRRNVRFPFAPSDSFIVIGFGRFAAILHKRLAIDTAKSEPDVGLAVLSLESPVPVIARGHIDPAWAGRLGAREAVFVDGDYLVALVRSDHFRTAAVAALPVRYLEGRSAEVALRLVPAGLLAGVALTLAILFLGRQQMSLPVAVKTALRRREFFVEYQPLVDLRSGAWVGVEALMRWRRPTGEIVMPDLFIPIAEQNGLIVRLTQQLLQMVARDTGAYLAAHPQFHVGINVAPADFHSSGFLDSLHATLHGIQARPGNIILEVTERGMLDPVVARQTTGALRRLGFAVAIDDFGTGYSSLSYLESLEVDYLKIDRSFIEAIGTGAPISQVVGHIIRMANDLGLQMIAEGIESQAQEDFLRKHGVQYGQGWLYGKSMAFAVVVRHIDAMQEAASLAQAG